jgi:hypothetical protein
MCMVLITSMNPIIGTPIAIYYDSLPIVPMFSNWYWNYYPSYHYAGYMSVFRYNKKLTFNLA